MAIMEWEGRGQLLQTCFMHSQDEAYSVKKNLVDRMLRIHVLCSCEARDEPQTS
jgi:hypothetical protein